jgi:alpha-L-rhamnosidase
MKLKLTISFFFLLFQQLHAQVSVQNLRCEMLVNPLGIDVKEPRLSWQLSSDQRNVQQTGYQIIVSSSKEKLQKDDGDIWNSGKQNSSQSIHLNYAGKPLQSATKYFWKVKVFTNRGEAASTEPSFFQQAYTKMIGKQNGSVMIKHHHGTALHNGQDYLPGI